MDIETAIASRIVEDAITQGYYVSVEDDDPRQGKITVLKTTDKTAIVKALNTTDSNTLYFHNREQKPCGWVLLAWGNGPNLISSCSANETIERILEGACKIADEYED